MVVEHTHFLDEPCTPSCRPDCSVKAAQERRAQATRGRWSPLEVRRESSGLRHYLHGEPVHCGVLLEIQALEFTCDDYGEYSIPVQRGAVVRYEARITHEGIRATLHADVGGHEFVTGFDAWMCFRWPTGR